MYSDVKIGISSERGRNNMQSYIRYDLVPQMINVASVLNEYFTRLLDDSNGLH